jgi:hypothetical protein
MKKKTMEDNEECVEKILKLLDEYNCKIEYDDELNSKWSFALIPTQTNL